MTVLPAPPPAVPPFAEEPVDEFFFVPVLILLVFFVFFDVFEIEVPLVSEESSESKSLPAVPCEISSLISSVDITLLSETTAVSTGLLSA